MLLLVVVYELLQSVVLAIALRQSLALLLMGQPFARLAVSTRDSPLTWAASLDNRPVSMTQRPFTSRASNARALDPSRLAGGRGRAQQRLDAAGDSDRALAQP